MSKLLSKHRLQFSLSLIVILILFGCSASPNSRNIDLTAMDAYIDPEIVGNERIVMRQILSALPEYARQDVIHLNDDGTLYTNRKANKGKGKVIKKQGNSDVWTDESGNPYPLPMPSSEADPFSNLQSNPSVSGIQAQVLANPVIPQCKLNGTGIEFRMDSKPGEYPTTSTPDFGGADVRVFVPSKASGDLLVDDPTGYYDTTLKKYINFGCKRDIQKDNPTTTTVVEGYGETPYVYLGGWGGDNANSRVDAGLQFNCPTTTTGSYSDYTAALFFSKQNPLKPTEFIAVNADRSTGFLTPNTIQLNFQFIPDDLIYPGDQGFFYLTATGIPLTGGTQTVTRTLTTNHNGWNSGGRYNIISLSTSIAQTPKKIVNGVPSYWVSTSPNPNSKFFANFTNLKLHSSGDLYATYPWNGYSYSDPYTDTAARNGICRMPLNNTSGIDPIEISGTSPAASSIGLTVDLLVK